MFKIDGVWVKVGNRCSILNEERKIKRNMTKDRKKKNQINEVLLMSYTE